MSFAWPGNAHATWLQSTKAHLQDVGRQCLPTPCAVAVGEIARRPSSWAGGRSGC